MTLPAGVTTCTVTIGKALSFLGTEGAISVSVSGSTTVVHAATGYTLFPVSDATSVVAGGEASFVVPHVNQSGFVNTLGVAITNWYYNITVSVTFPNGQRQDFTTTLQPLVGTTTVDLDLAPRTPSDMTLQPDISYVKANLADAKGDLLAASGDNVLARLAAGANGYMLVTDSTTATGLRWTQSPYGLVDAKGDLLVATADDTLARKAVGSIGSVLSPDPNSADGLAWQARPTLVTNLVPNPGMEGTGDTTGYIASGVTITASAAWAASGAKSLKLVALGGQADCSAGPGGDAGAMRLGMVAGRTYTVSATINTPAALTGSIHPTRAQRIDVFYSGAGGSGYVETLSQQGPTVGVKRLSVTVTLPLGTTEAFVRLYHGSPIAGEVVYWDDVMVTETPALMPYFDGDTPGCYWTGAPYASASAKVSWGQSDLLRVGHAPELVRNWNPNPSLNTTVDGCQVGGNVTATNNGFIRGGHSAVRLKRTNTTPGNAFVGQRVFLPAGKWTAIGWGRLVAGAATLSMSIVRNDFGEDYNTGAVGGNPTLIQGLDVCAWREFTIPAGGRYALIIFDQAGSATTSDEWMVGDVAIVPGTVDPFAASFDGDTPGARWLGAPRASESIRMIDGPDDLVFRGSGMPEGRVTARVGAKYTDVEATNGAVEWMKASGTGNTGWRVTYGDTGWRALAVLNGWTATTTGVKIRRTHAGVDVVLYTVNGSASTNATAFYIPVGFEVDTHSQDRVFSILTGGGVVARIDSRAFEIYGATGSYNESFFWPSTGPWPTGALPGDAS